RRHTRCLSDWSSDVCSSDLGAGMSELDRKASSVFAGKVVRKDLVRKIKVGANVPVFVLEYLLGKYCATDDPAAIEAGMRVVNSRSEERRVGKVGRFRWWRVY